MKESSNGHKSTSHWDRYRIGTAIERFGDRVKGIAHQAEQEPADKTPELKIDGIFYNSADAMQQYFRINSALNIPVEKTQFFRNRLAVTIADKAYRTESYPGFDGKPLFNRTQYREDWKDSSAVSFPYRSSDFTDIRRTNLEGELQRAAEHSLKLITSPSFHEEYQVFLFDYLKDKTPAALMRLAGGKNKEAEDYQLAFAEDVTIWGYKQRIIQHYEAWLEQHKSKRF